MTVVVIIKTTATCTSNWNHLHQLAIVNLKRTIIAVVHIYMTYTLANLYLWETHL